MVSSLDGLLEWSFLSEEDYFGPLSPLIADLDGNGIFEIIACSGEHQVNVNQLYVLDSDGKVQWIYETEYQITTNPSAADIDDDGRMEILFADMHFLYCLDYKGRELWRFEQITFATTPCIADIDGDGILDILTIGRLRSPSRDFYVYCLDNLGEVKWSKKLNDEVFHSASVADLDDDGYLEILFGSISNNFYCLDHTGEEKWRFVTNETANKSPSIADIDNDGQLEILFTSYDTFVYTHIYCLNSTGGEEWSCFIGNHTSFISLADLDDDETLEAIFCSDDGRLYCLDHQGFEEWSISLNGFLEDQSIVDIDGDGTLEIVGVTDTGVLYCINHLGTVEWQSSVEGECRAAPCVADLENDGSLEIIFGADSFLYCFTSSTTQSFGALPWYRHRGSIFSTGNIDSDGDYLDDVTEMFYSTNSSNKDSDGDDLIDGLEVQIGLNPLVNDADEDEDNDGLTNYEELKIYHTSIFTSDTDKDGRKDGWEIEHGSDPLRWDNWTYLFGLYFLPLYGGIIAVVIIFLRKLRGKKLKKLSE